MLPEVLRVYTAQSISTIERLSAGDIHVQPWSESAAYMLDEPARSSHRRAYEYMVHQYQIRTGKVMTAAPCFVAPDIAKARSALRRKASSAGVLALDIPRSDLLMHNYQFWAWIMLSTTNRCGHHEWEELNRCPSKPTCAIESWSLVFDLPDEIYNLQAVVNRIEPSWLVSIE
jgi:hypothetical protein